MDSKTPVRLSIYWDGEVEFFENGLVKWGHSLKRTSFLVDHTLSYDELVDFVYKHVGVDRSLYIPKINFFYEIAGGQRFTSITSDDAVKFMLSFTDLNRYFIGECHIELVEKPQVLVNQERVLHRSDTSFLSLLRTFDGTLPSSDSYGACGQNSESPSFLRELPGTINPITLDAMCNSMMQRDELQAVAVVEEATQVRQNPNVVEIFQYHDSDNVCNGEFSGEDSDSSIEVGVDSDADDGYTVPIYGRTNRPYNDRVMKFMNDIGNAVENDIHDEDEKLVIDKWKMSDNEIRVGMRFESKQQLHDAISLWSVSKNREFKVVESKYNTWVAKCKLEAGCAISNSGEGHYSPPCSWRVRGLLCDRLGQWKITRWVPAHNCIGSTNSNNNTNLSSSLVASLILHSIEADPGYPVKNIRAYIKEKLNVDITYMKGWYGRRRAVECIHGDWDSNFAELPAYMAALEASNPNTVVKWLHCLNSRSNTKTFKYVFWAFGPVIDAFHACRPVISVDGTHLRGAYKGKMLVAVTKDANNRILPLAYSIVDEETVESWSWFFEQFRYYVAQDRHLCVISDRHRGIIHAMSNLVDWQEPFSSHRFCLRHVRSNLTSRFNDAAVKELCWSMGITTEKRQFRRYRAQMRQINPAAWDYLSEIEPSQWSLAYDDNRRWGMMTTNISESMNNVLRGARRLPIRACINLTFNRTVELFRKYSSEAVNCSTVLPPNMWDRFIAADRHGQSLTVSEFNYQLSVYCVVSPRHPDDHGLTINTIHYFKRTCTCGKWQTHRFPCSHALAVCRHRGDAPMNIVDGVYSTETYRRQYSSDFLPLLHVDYWKNPGWCLQADSSKYHTGPGRRRESRIHNEMDATQPDKPRKCSLCRQSGHNRSKCATGQPRMQASDT